MKRILMVAALVVTAGACASGTTHSGARSTTTTTARAELVAALQPADSCADLLSWIHAGARAQVGPYGLDSGPSYGVADGNGGSLRAQAVSGSASTDTPLAAEPTAGSDAAGSTGTTKTADPAAAVVGTNDQEAGVDELDRFKSDGHRAVMTDGQRLMALDLDGPTPTKLGELDLPMTGARLFLRGDHVLAVGDGNAASNSGGGFVVLVDVDLSAGTPRIASQASVDGQLLDGRLADNTVRLVVSTPEPTRVSFVTPSSQDPAAIKSAVAANQTAIDQSTIGQWLPSWTPPGGAPTPLTDCSSVFHPQQWAGSSMLSVLSITDGLSDLHPVGVVTDGQTIYASTSALYVATQQSPGLRWNGDGTPKSVTAEPTSTAIHRFDVSTDGPATYQGSGTVAGTLLNQYAMSEQAGDLRVVTTTGSTYGGGPVSCDRPGFACPMVGAASSPPAVRADDGGFAGATTSEPVDSTTTSTPTATTTTSPTAPPADGTLLTVLRLQGEQLTQVGRLAGLAPGEQVQAVRFLGDQAYIVTFRQYDPLFVVDLSDPTAPKLLGQLTAPGFSAYLHPVGPHLLFGVGTAVDSNEPDGSKVALYATSDPTRPTQVAGFDIPGQGTTLDNDPHAFTWDPDRHLAFVETTVGAPGGPTKTGMMVYRIDDHSITWVGWIDHSAHAPTTAPGESAPSCGDGTYCPAILPPAFPAASYVPPVDRVIVVGDRVLAASTAGVSAVALDTFAESAWIGW